MASQRKGQDLEAQTRDIRKQLSDQIGSLEFRTESKISMLNDLQEFFKKRSEVEMEYMRGLDRLVEKCEKATRQRNTKAELHTTHLLWNSLLSETRKAARERGNLAEFYNTEMQVMLDIMLKDLHFVTKKCKEYCIEIQDKFLKELKDLLEAMKAYQYSSHNTQEAYNKLCRSKEKLDSMKQSGKANSRRKEQLESKEAERQQQYKENQQRQIKFQNDYLLCLHSCNAFSNQYFNKDLLDLIEQMDYDYHGGLHRIAESYRETEHTSCRTLMSAADTLFEQANLLSFDTDLQLFLKENGITFTAPIPFSFVPYGEDVEEEIKLTESSYNDVEKDTKKFETEAKTLELKVAEETKTLQHMTKNVLEKYKIVPCREAPPAPAEEPTEGAVNSTNLSASLGSEDARKTLSMERDRTSMLAPQNVRLQMFHNSQKGKKDEINFTLEVFHRKLVTRSLLASVQAKHNVLKQAFEKAPPAAFASDIGPAYHLRELPKLFGGDLVNYIEVTRVKIPLIVTSCCTAIEARGLNVEGLFRVPGPAQHIEELRKEFEEGKNPLVIPGKEKYKTDINAIASTLKAYFRELQTPLFPMDKYTEFIACARKDSDERCASIKATVHALHPSVVDVMAYLFKFLYKVSNHSQENKMNSSNLALVFGPTLVQAPTHLEALQLHNDVPAVNVLIQVCIEQHDVIFPSTAVTPPPPPVTDEPRSLSVSPLPQTTTSEMETSNTSDQQLPGAVKQVAEEAARVVSPPKLTEQDIDQTLDSIADATTSRATPDIADQQKQTESVTSPPPTATKEQQQEEKNPLSPVTTQQPQPVAPISAPSQQGTITETPLSPKLKASFTAKLVENESKEEEEDDETDSDTDDDDDDVTTMTVKAIYNYTARNQKELSFAAGEILQVTEKTSDGNWWDGFHNDKRGYIPVTYVEIMELRTTLKSPLPPERRSSTQPGVTEMPEATQEANEVEGAVPNKQVEFVRQQSAPPLSPSPTDRDASPQPEPISSPTHLPLSPTRAASSIPTVPEESLSQPHVDSPESTSTFKPAGVNVQSATLPSRSKDVPAPAAPKMPTTTGNVKNKMAQFLSSSQPQPVAPSDTPARPPSPGHRRMKSEGSSLEYRSVKQLTQAYNPGTTEKGREYPPPPTRPKPRPSAELTRNKEALEHAINFPIMPHTGVTQVSPLQQKLFSAQTEPHPPPPPQQQQQQQSKPAVLTKPKGSFRKQPKGKTITKPPPPPQAVAPPKGGFVPPPSSNPRDPTALHEELRAVASARTRKADKDTTV